MHGEVSHPPRAKAPPGPQSAIPSMIVGAPQTGQIQVVDLDAVLDLSSDVGADAWMAEGGTNLLSAHRWKSVRNFGIALGILAAVGIGIALVVTNINNTTTKPVEHVVTPPVDAAIKKPIADIPDAADDHGVIEALSKYGFFSITATAKTVIYVDDKNIGETPLTRLPLKPGPHTVKAVGPKGKSKIIKITIIGGRDTDEGSIDW